jgi:HAMP domain-containing protein
MTIKAKIISLVFAFALMAAAITGLGLKTVHDYETTMQRYNRASENVFRSERLNHLLLGCVVEVRGLFMPNAASKAASHLDSTDAALSDFDAYLKDWQKASKANELPELPLVVEAAKPLIDGWRQTVTAGRSTPGDAVYLMHAVNQSNLYQRRVALQERIDAMVRRISADMSAERLALKAYHENRVREFVLVAAAGTLGLLAASLWVAVSAIANPLNRMRQSIISISEGAYDTLIPLSNNKDEISEVLSALAILKDRAIEADKLTREKLENAHKLRELMLD